MMFCATMGWGGGGLPAKAAVAVSPTVVRARSVREEVLSIADC